MKMLAMCLLTAFSETTSPAATAAFDRPSAMSASTSRSRGVSRPKRYVPGPLGEQLGDDLGVHDRAAGRHPADRVDELAHVHHPVLEQVADAATLVRQQLAGVERLHVLREHQDRKARHLLSSLDGRQQPFVGERRRQPHVEDGDIGSMLEQRAEDRRPVPDGRHHLDVVGVEQPDQAVPQEG